MATSCFALTLQQKWSTANEELRRLGVSGVGRVILGTCEESQCSGACSIRSVPNKNTYRWTQRDQTGDRVLKLCEGWLLSWSPISAASKMINDKLFDGREGGSFSLAPMEHQLAVGTSTPMVVKDLLGFRSGISASCYTSK